MKWTRIEIDFVDKSNRKIATAFDFIYKSRQEYKRILMEGHPSETYFSISFIFSFSQMQANLSSFSWIW